MRKKTIQKPDIEKLAAEAKAQREQRCDEAIKKDLESHNCQMTVVVNTGERWIPLNTILNLPIAILVNSK